MNRTYPPIGTVSHATLRTDDLLPAFMEALAEYSPDAAKGIQAEIDELWPDDCCLEQLSLDTIEELERILNEDVWEALDEIAPPLCYFGAHPGDGSDFGFWPCELEPGDDESNDVTRCEELPDADRCATGYALQVNDHGNATLYEKVTEWREVWAVV